MLFVSSFCSHKNKIGEAVRELAQGGFRSIELSGGTGYYAGYEDDLLELKAQYGLSYNVHNYFPPPEADFVFNLGSLDDAIYRKSINHALQAMALCRRIGAENYSFHAAFYMDPDENELGHEINANKIYDRRAVHQRFCEAYEQIKRQAEEVTIFLENNVCSQANTLALCSEPLGMLVSAQDYFELKEAIDFQLLLDLGHLRVSMRSLCLDYQANMAPMLAEAQYLHLSYNNGVSDQHLGFSQREELCEITGPHRLDHKLITLEIREGIDKLNRSYAVLSDFVADGECA